MKIAQGRRSLGFILVGYLLPLMLAVSAAEAYSLYRWGKPEGMLRQVTRLAPNVALVYTGTQVVVALLVVFIGARLVKRLAETFHARHTFVQAFTAVAYGLGPWLWFRLLDVWPPMNGWITWGLGLVFAIMALYHGLPRMLQPDPPHAFGLFCATAFTLTVLTGLARLVAHVLLHHQELWVVF